VGLGYDDGVTMAILDRLCLENLSLEAAVKAAMQEKGTDPVSGAELKYYPDPAGNQTLTGLLKKP
jgi:hypothetical protein